MLTVSSKLQNDNVYTLTKRNVEGEDMLYQSWKLNNSIWILAELHIQPGNPNYMLLLKCRAPEVSRDMCRVYSSFEKLTDGSGALRPPCDWCKPRTLNWKKSYCHVDSEAKHAEATHQGSD